MEMFPDSAKKISDTVESLGGAHCAVELMISEDPSRIRFLVDFLEMCNAQRQQVQKNIWKSVEKTREYKYITEKTMNKYSLKGVVLGLMKVHDNLMVAGKYEENARIIKNTRKRLETALAGLSSRK